MKTIQVRRLEERNETTRTFWKRVGEILSIILVVALSCKEYEAPKETTWYFWKWISERALDQTAITIGVSHTVAYQEVSGSFRLPSTRNGHLQDIIH
jgi:hypothetical protein